MKRLVKLFVVAFVSSGAVALWAYAMLYIANHANMHPSSMIYGALFAYAVLGGIAVSLVPGIFWNGLEEDEELPGALE